jgi:hypothetical protein
MVVDPDGLEATLLEELDPSPAGQGRTLVAFALTAGTMNP